MKRQPITCAHCGLTFTPGWSEEEAKAEAREIWGEDAFERMPMAVVCDDCFTAMNAIRPMREAAEEHRKAERFLDDVIAVYRWLAEKAAHEP